MQRERRTPAKGRTPKPPLVVDRQGDLEKMRDALLAAMAGASVADLPRVCRELRAVDAELAQLVPTKSEGQELVDELKAKRARRSAS